MTGFAYVWGKLGTPSPPGQTAHQADICALLKTTEEFVQVNSGQMALEMLGGNLWSRISQGKLPGRARALN